MPVDHYAMEFGTVQVDIGRRAGKTEYITRNAKPGDLIVTFNALVKRDLEEAMKREVEIVTANKLIQDLHRMRGDIFRNTYARIYVDEPSLVFRDISRDELYSKLAKNYHQTFVLLGR